jgi:maleylacetoacetate isomerase
MKLYGFWRSLATYRVKVALALKGMKVEEVSIDLLKGMQHQPDYKAVNPQATVPSLIPDDGGAPLFQSMAIMEYVDETWPEPALLPTVARDRQRARAIAQMIACDIHPLNNLRVMQYLEREFNAPKLERESWTKHWIEEGFKAIEALLDDSLAMGLYCEGDEPSLADVYLIPQVYNARRAAVDLTPFPIIRRIDENCLKLAAFERARPENQPDAPKS